MKKHRITYLNKAFKHSRISDDWWSIESMEVDGERPRCYTHKVEKLNQGDYGGQSRVNKKFCKINREDLNNNDDIED